MKKFVLIALIAVFAAPVLAADLLAEAYEIRLEGSYDLSNNEDDSHVQMLGGLGYYLQDNLLVGGFISLEKKIWESYWGVSDVWGLGAYGEYNFNLGDAMVPYIGASVGFLDGSDPDNDTVFLFDATVGLKVFITETVALTADVTLSAASDEIYDFEDKVDEDTGEGNSTDVTAGLGIRFLL